MSITDPLPDARFSHTAFFGFQGLEAHAIKNSTHETATHIALTITNDKGSVTLERPLVSTSTAPNPPLIIRADRLKAKARTMIQVANQRSPALVLGPTIAIFIIPDSQAAAPMQSRTL